MSFSESSSMCGDDDQDLLGNEEEDIDFYSILNVPKNVCDFAFWIVNIQKRKVEFTNFV